MGFIAPFIPALVKGGAALGTSLLGSKLSGGSGGIPKQQSQSLINQQLGSIQQSRDIATSLQPQAQGLLSGATQSYSPVASYFGRLLAGNRNEAVAGMSPEIQRINQGYDRTAQAASTLTPRGGGRSSLFASLPFERTRDITNLLATSRPQAAQGMLATAQSQGNQAQSLYSTLLAALTGAGSNSSGLLNYDLQSRAAQNQRGQELGGGIYDILFPQKNKDGSGGGGGLFDILGKKWPKVFGGGG